MDINFQETFDRLKETLNNNKEQIKKYNIITNELEKESLKIEGALEMLVNISNALKENEENKTDKNDEVKTED